MKNIEKKTINKENAAQTNEVTDQDHKLLIAKCVEMHLNIKCRNIP